MTSTSSIHGTKFNEVFQADLLYMHVAEESNINYFLLIKEDIISCTSLYLCENEDSGSGPSTLSKWMTCFECMNRPMTDQGSHLVAYLTNSPAKEAGVCYQFTSPYSTCGIGTVETSF